MSESRKPLFREESLKRLSNPEQLNDYLSVTGVGIWLALAAVVALLASLLIWGVFGRVAIYDRATGFQENGSVRLYVQDRSAYQVGMAASVDGASGRVTEVAEQPVSRDQLSAQDSYLVYALQVPEYSYEVQIDAAGPRDGPVSVMILREQVRPISFILGGGGES